MLAPCNLLWAWDTASGAVQGQSLTIWSLLLSCFMEECSLALFQVSVLNQLDCPAYWIDTRVHLCLPPLVYFLSTCKGGGVAILRQLLFYHVVSRNVGNPGRWVRGAWHSFTPLDGCICWLTIEPSIGFPPSFSVKDDVSHQIWCIPIYYCTFQFVYHWAIRSRAIYYYYTIVF